MLRICEVEMRAINEWMTFINHIFNSRLILIPKQDTARVPLCIGKWNKINIK